VHNKTSPAVVYGYKRPDPVTDTATSVLLEDDDEETGEDLGDCSCSPQVEAIWLRFYLTAGVVQCSQRLLDAT